MIRRSTLTAIPIVILVMAGTPAITLGEESARLLPNGTLLIQGGSSDDFIAIRGVRSASDTIEVTINTLPVWTFPASDVKALNVSTGDGNDSLSVRTLLASWTLSSVHVDFGPGTRQRGRFSVCCNTSPVGWVPASVDVLGDVRVQGGSFTIAAGDDAVSQPEQFIFLVHGDYAATGGPGNDSLGIETEFPSGMVYVKGDVSLKGGDGEDYLEINANGPVTVEGDFTAKAQAGPDFMWFGGAAGGVVLGTTTLDGGEGEDELEVDNLATTELIYRKFETCVGCP